MKLITTIALALVVSAIAYAQNGVGNSPAFGSFVKGECVNPYLVARIGGSRAETDSVLRGHGLSPREVSAKTASYASRDREIIVVVSYDEKGGWLKAVFAYVQAEDKSAAEYQKSVLRVALQESYPDGEVSGMRKRTCATYELYAMVDARAIEDKWYTVMSLVRINP